jgi:copper chaperone
MNTKLSYVVAVLLTAFGLIACSSAEEHDIRQVVFTVEGMYCEGCVGAVTNEIQRIDGATNISVTLDDSLVVFSVPSNKMPSDEALRKAIEDLGYIVHLNTDSE